MSLSLCLVSFLASVVGEPTDAKFFLQALPPDMFDGAKVMRPEMHSYLQQYTKHKSAWADVSNTSDHPIRRIIRYIQQHMVPDPPPNMNYSGVEFWLQNRKASSPLYMHFDVAESVKVLSSPTLSKTQLCSFCQKDTKRIRLPKWSCILYLSSCGGPTLVVQNKLKRLGGFSDQAAELSPSGVNDGTLIYPEANSLAVFPGNLLHGVIPDISRRSFKQAEL